jgi:CBS domain containing-hemolysin-like protein
VIILIYFLLVALLLLLNAFFVLAEFSAVKMRPSRVEALIAQDNSRARVVKHIQDNLDEYLSVCQVGITLTSIGLGFVGEPAFANLIILVTGTSSATAHAMAVTIAYILVSSLHIVLGELVPKALAIRRPEGSSLFIALPLRFFRTLFFVPLVILNGAQMGVLRLLGIRGRARETEHSEDELRIILEESQSKGVMTFRRLLLLENIFDLGGVRVRDAMRSRTAVKVLQADAPWDANLKVIRESRFSRFPLLDGKSEMPVGVVHVKDLLYEGPEKMAACDLRKIARPFHTTTEETPLENLLSDLQRHRGHLAMVRGADNKWTGFISLEDIIEEIIGTIEDEFEVEPPTYLADAMTEGRVVLGIRAANLPDAVGAAFGTVAESSLPLPLGKLVTAVLERERAMSTYLGNGLAIPHARIEGLEKPTILFARSEEGIPTRKPDEKAHLIFILLTPAGAPRAQVRLLARICGLIDSEYVAERLLHAETPAGVLEAVRAGEPLTVR